MRRRRPVRLEYNSSCDKELPISSKFRKAVFASSERRTHRQWERNGRTPCQDPGPATFLVLLFASMFCCWLNLYAPMLHSPTLSTDLTGAKRFPSTVTLLRSDSLSRLTKLHQPRHLADKTPDYNGLVLGDSPVFERKIQIRNVMLFEQEKTLQLHTIDDDMHHSERKKRTTPATGCRTPPWAELHFPVCNTFHELLNFKDNDSQPNMDHLGSGHFRDGYMFRDRATQDDFVLKSLRLVWYLSFSEDELDRVRREALVMERLSTSGRTTNLYGHCSSSIMVEAAPQKLEFDVVPFTEYQSERGRISTEELAKMEKQTGRPVLSLNTFSAEEKLDMAIAMAESIAVQHGFDGSVIVNDDVLLEQWLVTPSGRVVLTDFNFVIFLQWHHAEQKYCKPYRNYGTPFRSPESYEGGFIDEATDVFPFGHLVFNLLTGLYPYGELPANRPALIEQMAIDGVRPYMNPSFRTSSLIERRLVEIMDRCYEPNPSKRINIFQVVDHLHQTKSMNQEETNRSFTQPNIFTNHNF